MLIASKRMDEYTTPQQLSLYMYGSADIDIAGKLMKLTLTLSVFSSQLNIELDLPWLLANINTIPFFCYFLLIHLWFFFSIAKAIPCTKVFYR
jgi:hypothetical protein